MQGLGYVVIALFLGTGAALIARAKGNPVWIWFLIGFLVPVAGILASLFARAATDEPRRLCDACGKVLPVSDTLCTGCGEDLNYPDEVILSRREELSGRRA